MCARAGECEGVLGGYISACEYVGERGGSMCEGKRTPLHTYLSTDVRPRGGRGGVEST